MTNYRVVPKVTYENTKIFHDIAARRWKVPKGVTAHEPIHLNWGEMSKKESSKVPAPAGLTKSLCDVEAPGILKVSSTATDLPQWTFGGGDIILNIAISIYIVDEYARKPDVLKIIMEHEYIHVNDTLSLANGFAGKLEGDPKIRSWLKGEPWTGADFFSRIGDLFHTQTKALGDKLDSGPAYEKHKRDLLKLMRRKP